MPQSYKNLARDAIAKVSSAAKLISKVHHTQGCKKTHGVLDQKIQFVPGGRSDADKKSKKPVVMDQKVRFIPSTRPDANKKLRESPQRKVTTSKEILRTLTI